MHIFPAGTHTAKYMRYLVERASGVFAVWGMPSTLPETEAFLTVNGGHRSQRLEVLEEFRRLGEVLAGFTAPGLVPEPDARPGGAVADQLVDDVLTTAFEGGSNYWCQMITFQRCPGASRNGGLPAVVALGGTIAVCDTHAPHEPGTQGVVTREAVLAAVEKLALAREAAGREAGDIRDYGGDADDADWILQAAVFGKQVFG